MMKVLREVSLKKFREHVEAVRSCGDHPMPNLTNDVLKSVTGVVEAYIEEAESYEDTSSKIIVELRDGTFGVFHEWSDSSGHG